MRLLAGSKSQDNLFWVCEYNLKVCGFVLGTSYSRGGEHEG